MQKKYTVFFIFTFLFFFVSTWAQQNNIWKATGPTLFPENISGQINGIGRVCQLRFHPSQPNTMYAVSASGGLWISKDASKTWQVMGTDALPHTPCASVCVDVKNDSIIYLGCGDPNYYYSTIGIWKTTDGGKNWNPSNENIGNRMALDILMDPDHDSVLIAATNDGIWKSVDAGAHWSVKLPGIASTNMAFQPKAGTQIIYATSLDGFYRSANMGDSWTKIETGLLSGDGRGCRLAVTKSNPAVVYVGMVKNEGMIFKSIDTGKTFLLMRNKPTESITGYDANGNGQGNYNFSMTADPNNENTVYIASHCVWRSTDGGINFKQLTQWYAGLHTDMHHIVHSPYDATKLFESNDGGVWLSTDKGAIWKPVSDYIGATECYHASQSPTRSDMVSIGTQDNGGLCYVDNLWKTNRGGDWSSVEAFDYSGTDMVYYLTNGNRKKLTDGGKGAEGTFNSPFFSSNAAVIDFSPMQYDLAFIADQGLWRCQNLNSGIPQWYKILDKNNGAKAIAVSPDDMNTLYLVAANSRLWITHNALSPKPDFVVVNTPAATGLAASITAIRENEDVLYLTCGNKVFRSSNQGKNWTDITAGLPPLNILKIYHDAYSNNESVYIGNAKGVYYRNKSMNSWINYSSGLPTIADITEFMMFNDGTENSLLRVAYYGRGVWEVPLYQDSVLKAAFSSLTKTCTEIPVRFVGRSSGKGLSYTWNFEGGSPSSSVELNPEVFYSKAGTYSVQLIVKNEKGISDTLTLKDYITVNPLKKPLIKRNADTLYTDSASSYQWFKNGNIIYGAIKSKYIPTENGQTYSVVITDSNFCVNESDPYDFYHTGVLATIAVVNHFNVYPNPAGEECLISFNVPLQGDFRVNIFNAIGQKVYSEELPGFSGNFTRKLSLEKFSKGVYTLRLTGKNTQITKELVVD